MSQSGATKADQARADRLRYARRMERVDPRRVPRWYRVLCALSRGPKPAPRPRLVGDVGHVSICPQQKPAAAFGGRLPG